MSTKAETKTVRLWATRREAYDELKATNPLDL